MNLTPEKFIQASAILILCCAAVSFVVEGTSFAAGVLASGAVLVLNLYFWSWFIRRLLDAVTEGGSAGGLSLFIGLKLLVLSTSMLVLMQFFSPSVLIVGNSAVAAGILLPSFASCMMPPAPGFSK